MNEVSLLYEKTAAAITDALIKKEIIDGERAAVYAYGFEIMISYFCYFAIAAVISAATHTLLESLIFLVGFIMIRRAAGGYHASTYLRCHILFALNHILFIAVHNCLLDRLYMSAVIFVPLLTVISVFLFAPIDHTNKPFTQKEYSKFKKRSRICAVAVVFITVAAGFIAQLKSVLFSFLFGVLSAVISLIVAYILKKRNLSILLKNKKKGE